MESLFGADFRDVRVHTDASAAQAAEQLGAVAFTSGRDIYFAAGRYASTNQAGRRLLAHELAHVLQQRRGAVRRGMDGGAAADRHEHEAERWAARAGHAPSTPTHRIAPDTRVAESGSRLHLPDRRCPMDEPCPDEPLADHQGSGETTCDPATGTMGSTFTEHCAGDCVSQHEAVHRTDRSTCCSRVKLCLDNAGADAARRSACTTAFNTWFPTLSDWTECNAYTREVTCLTDFIRDNCGEGGATGADCCRTLRDELRFARSQRTTRCASARNSPCPFRADGTLPAP